MCWWLLWILAICTVKNWKLLTSVGESVQVSTCTVGCCLLVFLKVDLFCCTLCISIHLILLYIFFPDFEVVNDFLCPSQWPRGLKAWVYVRSLAGIVGSNPTGDVSVYVECCVLSGRGLCDWLITRPEESYRLWCVVVCGIKTSRMRRPWPALGRRATGEKNNDFF